MDRSLVSRLWAVSIVAGGLALLVGAAAALRWREIGWGGFAWLAAFFAMMAIRTPYALRTRANAIVESRTDRTDWVLVTGLVVGGFVLPLLFLATSLLQVADYHLPVWATALGTVLQLPALWLMWRWHADLGLN